MSANALGLKQRDEACLRHSCKTSLLWDWLQLRRNKGDDSHSSEDVGWAAGGDVAE